MCIDLVNSKNIRYVVYGYARQSNYRKYTEIDINTLFSKTVKCLLVLYTNQCLGYLNLKAASNAVENNLQPIHSIDLFTYFGS